MHEMSLMRSLLNQVEAIRQNHQAESVTEIELELGPLSGVEPLLLQSAFETQVTETAFPQARLAIREIPLTACCRDCSREFAIEQFQFICPHCRSGIVQVLKGDALRLLNVTLEVEPVL